MCFLQKLQIAIREISQGTSAALSRHRSRMFFPHYQIFNTLPSHKGDTFFSENQARVDQDKRMPRYVESTPESTRLQALGLDLHLNIASAQTSAVVGLNIIEQFCPDEPGNSSKYDAGQVPQQNRPTAAAQCVCRQGNPGHDHG